MTNKKILSLLLAIIMFITLFTACGNKGPQILDFEHYTERDLRRYEGEEVVLYGYLGLNASINNMAYLSQLPYMAILNREMKDGEFLYLNLTLQESKIIPIFFKENPQYTTAPIKVTGILKRVESYDDVAHVSFPYAITDASYSFVETYSLAPGFKEFAFFAKAGYPDVIYQNLLNLEMYSSGHLKDFPKEEHYEDIKKDFENSKELMLYSDYLKHLELTHDLFEKYGKQVKEHTIDLKQMENSCNAVVASFIKMMDKYASFKIVRNNDKGIVILEPTENVLQIPGHNSTEGLPIIPESESLKDGELVVPSATEVPNESIDKEEQEELKETEISNK